MIILAACKDGPIRPSYQPVLPELPRHWEEILGDVHWRLEWIAEGGIWEELEIPPGKKAPGLALIQEWSSPVLAWPYWPDQALLPGMMRPAGAIFPWDVSGGKLLLGWKAGVEAVLWKELAAADRTTAAADGRLPWYFDWPRFRELLESENIPEAVRLDPWLADWRDIGQRTVQSGFDRRRIRSRSFKELAIPGLGGRWIGSSPFTPPLDAAPGGPLLIMASDAADSWVSAGGTLRGSVSGWVFIGK